MPPKSTPEILAFRRRLMRWFRRAGRDLPWRRTRDPYRVLVSEIMLQQTQVSRVTEYYPRFLTRFPTLDELARARPAEVREAWDGLGYYRRAANLHRLAQVVVADHAGELPADPGRLQALPGVGRYTAGAVASFAFEQCTAAVDTNVSRVIRRAFVGGRAGVVATQPPSGAAKRRLGHKAVARTAATKAGHKRSDEERIWEIARRLVPRAGIAAWTFNQAIMELGATICTARVARCEICPVREGCKTGRRRVPDRS